MTISDLQKKTAEVLGVSSSEKELAFEILITKVAAVLTEDLTLKIPRIGFFQLREDDNENSLIFSPLSEDFTKETRTLYLTIELPKTGQPDHENDSGVFSISVGKPLLPLTEDVDKKIELETSYAILRKSIEERVNEIIADSEHLPSFNIWDDYYVSLNKPDQEEQDKLQLSELTDDIEYKEDLIAEDITNNLLNQDEDNKIEEPAEHDETPQEELSPTALLEDYVPKIEEPEVSTQVERTDDEIVNENAEEVKDDSEPEETLSIVDEINAEEEIDNLIESIEEIESKQEEIELPEDIDADESDEDFLGLKKKVEENIDWNWGDELKEEIEQIKGSSKKTTLEFDDIEEGRDEEEDPEKNIFKSTKPLSTDYFTKLETTIKKEIEETEKDFQYMEYSGHPPKYEFVEDVPPHEPEYQPTITQQQYFNNFKTNDESSSYEEYHKNDDKYFGKTFLLLFFGFVIISSIIIYFLMSGKKTNNELNEQVGAVTDSTIYDQQTDQIDTNRVVAEDLSDFPRVASVPVNDQDGNKSASLQTQQITEPVKTNVRANVPARTIQTNDLYKTLQTDTRVGRTIYFDGSGFNVQVSSWRNKGKAEDEVKRLRGRGFDAFLVEANLPQKGGIWYRVRIGNFKSSDEAEQFLVKNNFEK
ncbi:MAG: SPOR domain-containing protein [Bacteroidota bacterium]